MEEQPTRPPSRPTAKTEIPTAATDRLIHAWARAITLSVTQRDALDAAQAEANEVSRRNTSLRRDIHRLNGIVLQTESDLRRLRSENENLAREIAAIRSSLAWRAGRLLDWAVGAPRRLVRSLSAPRAERPAFAVRTYSERSTYEAARVPGRADADATLVFLSERHDDDFSGLADGFRAEAAAGRLDVVVASGAPVEESVGLRYAPMIGDVDPAEHLDRIIRRASGRFVLVVSRPGTLSAGALGAFARLFECDATIAAACGLVTSGDAIVWAGAEIADTGGRLQPSLAGMRTDDDRAIRVQNIEFAASGCLAVDKSLYVALGGLRAGTGGLLPAVIDYSQRVRENGYRLCVEPFVTLDTPAADAWPGGEPLDPAVVAWHASIAPLIRRRRPRLLMFDAATPKPDRDSGSNDVVWLIRIFQEAGYDVTFVPVYERAHAGRYTDDLRRLGVRTPVEPRLDDAAAFVKQEAADYDLVVINRITVAASLLPLVRAVASRAKTIFNTVDLHFLRQAREAEFARSDEGRAEAESLRHREIEAITAADAAIVVSTFEHELASRLAPRANLHLVPLMRPIPGRLEPRPSTADVLFIGGFGHRPNLDAVDFLCDEIWPLVRAALPEAVLLICGADAPERVTRRDDPSIGIRCLGHVDDLSEIYGSARVNVAPLRFGAGIKGKVVGALAAGLPSVVTPQAAEGMALTDSENAMIAEGAEAFASAIVRLCRDDRLWDRISEAGVELAAKEYSVDAARRRIRRLLDGLKTNPR